MAIAIDHNSVFLHYQPLLGDCLSGAILPLDRWSYHDLLGVGWSEKLPNG